MREKLQEHVTAVNEKYGELWDGAAEAGLWEGAISEYGVGSAREPGYGMIACGR